MKYFLTMKDTKILQKFGGRRLNLHENSYCDIVTLICFKDATHLSERRRNVNNIRSD